MKQNFLSLWASGNGSNAENIVKYFQHHPNIKVAHILTNKKNAGVISKAQKLNIPCFYFSSNDFIEGKKVLHFLLENNITHIILAGFLLKVPEIIIQHYSEKIVNIHPALLPAYGGKGMYGRHVHEAVLRDKQKKSGITIHYVDEEYDHGKILYQHEVPIEEGETVESLEQKIHLLEHKYYPLIIEKWINNDVII